MISFGKRNPLALEHFKEFVTTFGDSPGREGRRKDEGETGRLRRFTRDQITKRSDLFDIT